MSEDTIADRIQSIQEELSRIPAHPATAQKIADRRLMIELLTKQQQRIDRMRLAFLEHRVELLNRSFGPLARASRN